MPSPIQVRMLAIVVFVVVALPWLNPFSPGPTTAVGPLLFSWWCAALLLLALAVDRRQGHHTRMVHAIALAWLAGASISALIGLLQYFGATEHFGVWLNHTQVGEAYGNLRQRNQFATLINIGLVALVWLEASYRFCSFNSNKQLQHPWQAAGMLALAVLLGAGNAASSSRTGLFQLILVLVVALWWQRASGRRVYPVVLTAVLAYAACTIALPLLAGLDPLTSGAWARLRAGDAACTSRLTLWGNVLHLIGLKPWLGWGWGELDYAHFITLYPGARFCDILDNAHNLPLHLAVELGVPVALLASALALVLVWRGKPWRETMLTRQMAWGILAVILLHSLLEYPLWYGPFQMAAGLSLWLLWWQPRHPDQTQTYQKISTLAQSSKALAAIFLIVFCGIAAWNYHLASQIYLDPEDRASGYEEKTLEKTRGVWLYQDQVQFADLTITDLTPANAATVYPLALQMLHFSPEARVAEVLINSALLLGRMDDVAFYLARLRVAFPADYARWKQQHPAVKLD